MPRDFSTRRNDQRAGFSLIEVCMALAVVAFAIIPIMALLPVGLDSFHNTSARGRAVQIVDQIGTCLQLASSSFSGSTTTYTALTPFTGNTANASALTWITGGSIITRTYYFDVDGTLTTQANARYVAAVSVTPPSGSDPSLPTGVDSSKGVATVYVAWPATGAVVWSAASSLTPVSVPTIADIQGHEESTFPLAPIPQ